MTIARHITDALQASSWIRKMFEEGTALKARHGADRVCDFTLGNPNVPPPVSFKKTLAEVAADPATNHAYMFNAGYPETRQAVAGQVAREQKGPVTGDDIVMTCGAAGGLNVILKAILNPGETVVTPAPFFVEYRFYVENHGGRMITAPSLPGFDLDLSALDRAIDENTRAVLINSPNNPTGVVYSGDTIGRLGQLLAEKSRAYNRNIYLIADEPYRDIVYDNVVVPSLFDKYADSIVVTSYSKTLSLPGERIGFVAVNPAAAHKQDLLAAMVFTNRVLGFVNAPALMQRVIARMPGEHVNINEYARKRERLCAILSDCGYDFIKPAGAFYLFPKSPLADDVAFVRRLQQELVLAVPGSGFGGPGYFRLAYCVDDRTIENAAPGFKKAIDAVKS
jgi:aspartate aminotransferase